MADGRTTLLTRQPTRSYVTFLFILVGSFFLVFSCFNAAQSLDGSIPAPPGLAAIQFCVLYVTFGLLCIPAPKVISLTGPKWGIAVGMLTYVSLVASFLAPPYCTAKQEREHHSGDCWSVELIWALRLVTAVLVGVGASLVWTGQGVYLGQLAAHAVQQEELEMEAASATSASSSPIDENPLNDPEATRRERLGATLKRYNGIFWTCFQFSGTCGLVASSLELTLVQSASSTSYLFLGLTASCLFGVVSVIAFLPTLPAVTPLPRSPNLAATSTPVAEQESAVRREIVGTIATEDPSGGNAGATACAGESPKSVSVFAALHLCADPRLAFVVPNIIYNGLSLAFIWFLYNTFVFNTALGTSSVGFGSACFYTYNSLATALASRMAAQCGQRSTMLAAAAIQLLFFVLMLWYKVKPVQCLPSGCRPGTQGSCWRLPNGANATTAAAARFPVGCRGETGSMCAICIPFHASAGQQCEDGWRQCDWLRGDAVPPESFDVMFMIIGVGLFAIGDSVWESQVPAVLQTLFDEASGHQTAAMANIKLWQSFGIGAMFGLARLSDLRLSVLICLVCLLLSVISLLWLHARVACLDSGALRGVQCTR